MISIRRLKRNIISNAFGTIVPALAWFFVVPVLILKLGDAGYGVYTIAISFAGVLGFLELGLTSAATKFVAEVEIRNDQDKLEKIIANNLSIYIAIGIVISLVCLEFGGKIAPLLFHDTGLSQPELATMVLLMGLVLSLTLIKNAFASILMGLHRYDYYNFIQIGYAVLLALVQVLIVTLNGQVNSLLMGNIGVILASLVGFAVMIRKLLPGVHFVRLPDGYFLRVLFTFGMYMMVINLAGTLLFNLDKVIIGQILGPTSVSYYAIPSQITLKIHNGLAVFVSFLFPMASEVQSSGDKATMRNIFLQGMRFIALLDGAVMVFLAVFAQKILQVWISPDFAAQSSLLLVITAIGYIIYSLSITPYHILLGMGRPRALAIMNTTITLGVIAGLYFGLIWFGLVGGCVGVAIGFCTAAILPAFVQRKLEISWATIFKESYGRTLICTLGAALLSAFLPAALVIRLMYFAVFVVVLIFFGNTRLEDWRFFQNQWQRLVTQIVIMRKQIAHRN